MFLVNENMQLISLHPRLLVLTLPIVMFTNMFGMFVIDCISYFILKKFKKGNLQVIIHFFRYKVVNTFRVTWREFLTEG